MRARDLGIELELGRPGPRNAISDVAGVRVGCVKLFEGEAGPLVVGDGPVRTSVTAIVPHEGEIAVEPLFAGCHTLDGELLERVVDRFGRRRRRPSG